MLHGSVHYTYNLKNSYFLKYYDVAYIKLWRFRSVTGTGVLLSRRELAKSDITRYYEHEDSVNADAVTKSQRNAHELPKKGAHGGDQTAGSSRACL